MAWLGVVPFRMEGVGIRGVPDLPWLSAFPELNVRTYVTAGGKPGVWFFSLDAANSVAVWTARRFFHLPYYRAEMSVAAARDELVYRSRRLSNNGGAARLSARYGPVSNIVAVTPGSLDHWLTERYCLYSQAPDGRVYRGDVHHHRWALQRADAEIEVNTMTEPFGVSLPDQPPILHYSKRLDVVAWSPVPIDGELGRRWRALVVCEMSRVRRTAAGRRRVAQADACGSEFWLGTTRATSRSSPNAPPGGSQHDTLTVEPDRLTTTEKGTRCLDDWLRCYCC